MPILSSSDESIGVRVQTSADTKGIDQTHRALLNLGAGADTVSVKAVALGSTIGNLAANALTVAGQKMKSVGANAINSAGDFEQYRVAFETMLGSADKAKKLLTDISDFAKTTPFELPEVVKASKQLLAFGIEQENIIPTMRKLGDIAAGVGVPVGQLAYVFGQVRVAGKLMGGDLMQFTNAGVPMIEGLSKVLKVSQGDVKQMVEQGKVGFKEVQQVLDDMTGSGSKFGGMMNKQSQTLQGVGSNIKDSFNQVLRSMMGIDNQGNIMRGSFFDMIKNGAQSIMPKLQSIAEAIGPAMVNGINKARMAVFDFITVFKNPALTSQEEATKFDKFTRAVRATWDVIYNMLAPSIKALADTVSTQLFPALKELLPYVDDVAKIIGGAMVTAAWVAVNTINLMVKAVSNFIEYREQIAVVATVITTLLLPALLTAGKQALIAAAKSVFAAGTTKTAWVRSAVATSAAWWKSFALVVARGAWTATRAVAHAAAVSAVWIAHAAKTSAVWVVTELPKIVAAMSVTAIKAGVHAADASLAWVLNAARVSFVWVTTEMPKIVASFAVTSAQATAHAAVASAQWVASAAKTSVAWVVTELPKIIAAFVVTSGAAVAQAAISSAAWVADATKSSAAWVVFHLPKIIAGFMMTSAAAVAQAAITSAAWVTSAATSSQSFAAFRALVTTPLVMPAIAIAAAIASLLEVKRAVDAIKRAVDDVNNAAAAANNLAPDQQMRELSKAAADARARGDTAAVKRYANALAALGGSRASGGPVIPGVGYLVGDNPDGTPNRTSEIFVPNTPGTILPASTTQKVLQGGGTNNYFTGDIYLGDASAVDSFFSKLGRNNELAQRGLTTAGY